MHLGDQVEVIGANAGLHVMLSLRHVPMRRVRELRHRASQQGVAVYSVAPFYLEPPTRGALLLGYASLTETEIREGIRRLAQAMKGLAAG
jgi:GntR family transcriptional regulator/MocR family aminotransferase